MLSVGFNTYVLTTFVVSESSKTVIPHLTKNAYLFNLKVRHSLDCIVMHILCIIRGKE